MRVVLVHDYLKEYGGAERVLEALSEAFPDAPIYTAFYRNKSEAYARFSHKTIKTSWAHYIPFFATKLHSPLRFLSPLIWGSFDFSEYDVVISSASWYITKGFGSGYSHQRLGTDSGVATLPRMTNRKPIEICYCHTPPRWLYGYKTAVNWQKYWIVKFYAIVASHFMRLYDFRAAQRVDYFVANSKEVQARIKKFYRRDSVVIYPPVDLGISNFQFPISKKIPNSKSQTQKKGYYLIVSRLVGAKGIEVAIEAAQKGGFHLKIVGTSSGYGSIASDKSPNIEYLGFVSDEELVQLYTEAKGFLALATDEDFGITPVEAMSCGTGVIAYNGGGYKETVIEGKTGVFFDKQTPEVLLEAIKQFEELDISPAACVAQAKRFSKERFIKEIKAFVVSHMQN